MLACPDAEPFPSPLPRLGKCHQPFIRLVVTPVHFSKGHLSPPNRWDLQGCIHPQQQGWHPWDDARPEPLSPEGLGGAPWRDLTAVVAQCRWLPRARGQQVAAALQLAGRCSRQVVQPQWPALGSSPPRPRHRPPIFSAGWPAPLVAAAAASALVAGTAWLWPEVVALRTVAGLWPCSSSWYGRLKPDAGVGVGLQLRS